MIMNGLSQGGSDSRVPVIYTTSYVGTGTYGNSNPNTLTFDFVPEIIIWLGRIAKYGTDNYFTGAVWGNSSYGCLPLTHMVTSLLTTDYSKLGGPSFYNHINNAYYSSDQAQYSSYKNYAKKSSDGKTIYWYRDSGTSVETLQANSKNITYYVLALGYKEES